jgi:tRNA (Thr-GGU) A37 N-methylase
VKETRLEVIPFLDRQSHGVFATRVPARPNPVGISVVRLANREENVLPIPDVDVLDDRPLLEVKPCVPDSGVFAVDRDGWLERSDKGVAQHRSVDRFSKG